MTYTLGVDLGTTYTAAAVAEGAEVRSLQLDALSTSVPSVVFLGADGSLLVGLEAEQQGRVEPGRAGREFKRRLGDPTPLILGGTPFGAEALMGELLRAVLEMVTAEMGGAPQAVVLSHPANWGSYKLDLLGEAARQAEAHGVRYVPEPVAAASHIVGDDILEGSYVAVYDFGGGTFDAAVVRRVGSEYQLLGTPEGMDRFGGIDLDEAVMAHVLRSLETTDLDEAELVALREVSKKAKEQLSEETSATVPVREAPIRINRTEFEDLVRPRLEDTLEVLRRAVRSAELEYDHLDRVLLVGGSSRIPLVAEMVRTETGRTVVLDPEPKQVVARGAALIGARAVSQPRPDMTMPWSEVKKALEEAQQED